MWSSGRSVKKFLKQYSSLWWFLYCFTVEGIYYDVFRGRVCFMWSRIFTVTCVQIIVMDSFLLGSDTFALGTWFLTFGRSCYFLLQGQSVYEKWTPWFIVFEDDENMILQNSEKDLPIDAPLHTGRLESTSAPLCKPYILQDGGLLGWCSFADRYQRLGGSRFL